jgi:hypothetical protein
MTFDEQIDVANKALWRLVTAMGHDDEEAMALSLQDCIAVNPAAFALAAGSNILGSINAIGSLTGSTSIEDTLAIAVPMLSSSMEADQ